MKLQFPEEPKKLTPAEQRLLEFIEGNREEFLFMTIGQAAKRLQISEATVSRFARHVGCQDFKALKNRVLEQNHLEGPAGKLAGTLAGSLVEGGSFRPEQYLYRQQLCLEKTIGHMDAEAFEAAVQEILRARRIYIHAKSASACLGQLLFFRLRRLDLQVSMLPAGGSEMLEGLAQAGEEDLVIFFGFSKVSKEGRVILEEQKESGYRTVGFTGRLRTPQEEQADVSLYVYRGEPGEYHSMTAAAALVDALVVAVSGRRGADGAGHLRRLHQMKRRYLE